MPKIRKPQSPGSSIWWLRQRETGLNYSLGHVDRFYKTLYSSIQPVTSWDHGKNLRNAMHGGVFNLEYSPDGSLLVAACEKKSILMFDPLCRRLIHAIDNAHNDCVNCVKFLDHRMFATCSDDNTVALWDSRNLKQKIRSLHGHSKWVKSIEYSPRDELLLSSGFDGSIHTWDINSATENSLLYTRVFHTNGLMRTRLTPDASKMLISTTSGYLIIIHNLRLSTLSEDLAGFKPNVYRLMQLSQTTLPAAASFTHLFSHARTHNRVEFITDFPIGNDAEFISSLQVHPQGWCVLSRNVGNEEKSEWTCVHDIQERLTSSDVGEEEYEAPVTIPPTPPEAPPQPPASRSNIRFLIDSSTRLMNAAFGPEFTGSNRILNNFELVTIRSNVGSSTPRSESEDERVPRVNNDRIQLPSPPPPPSLQNQLNDTRRNRSIFNNNNFSTSNVELHVSSTDVWEALVALREARSRRERERELYYSNNPVNTRNWMLRRSIGDSTRERNSHTVVILGDRNSTNNFYRPTHQPMYAIPRNHKIHQNVSRLTHYIEEPNVGLGYIKELCFSADGRLICSPFGYGIRLLSFSNECQDLSHCVPAQNESVQLHELATNISHSDIVLSTKFSPKHCLLVSGCLSGKIVWHQPVV
ncbi:DDB1- and CUL4-associated factor 10 [Chelonus insularis]|uniref:DDB1- and CUL4-associated factor 10 n=1 Tax=Chelonus insularis TaxID=460826 RepID=UPI00158BA0F1|nr:DDB1- and CUL4-associated factor 10 [Chelonus insularis]